MLYTLSILHALTVPEINSTLCILAHLWEDQHGGRSWLKEPWCHEQCLRMVSWSFSGRKVLCRSFVNLLSKWWCSHNNRPLVLDNLVRHHSSLDNSRVKKLPLIVLRERKLRRNKNALLRILVSTIFTNNATYTSPMPKRCDSKIPKEQGIPHRNKSRGVTQTCDGTSAKHKSSYIKATLLVSVHLVTNYSNKYARLTTLTGMHRQGLPTMYTAGVLWSNNAERIFYFKWSTGIPTRFGLWTLWFCVLCVGIQAHTTPVNSTSIECPLNEKSIMY